MLLAAEPAAIRPDEVQFRACLADVKADPKGAADRAGDWRARGGGLLARECQGLAFVALERWQPAAIAFEQAAREAQANKDPRAGDFWVQSGNAWLAMNDGSRARAAFDAALASAGLSPQLRGEVHLDRARAHVALGDNEAARADLDKGIELVPGDPFGWYLSAALALRQDAVGRAQADIAKALELAPDDPDVLLLAGNLAGMTGESEAAQTFYSRAVRAAPNSTAGKAAQAALAANGEAADQVQP
jgi:tetratricopeptide (TPR) repeat protein